MQVKTTQTVDVSNLLNKVIFEHLEKIKMVISPIDVLNFKQAKNIYDVKSEVEKHLPNLIEKFTALGTDFSALINTCHQVLEENEIEVKKPYQQFIQSLTNLPDKQSALFQKNLKRFGNGYLYDEDTILELTKLEWFEQTKDRALSVLNSIGFLFKQQALELSLGNGSAEELARAFLDYFKDYAESEQALSTK